MIYPENLNRYGLATWVWHQRLGEPEPNKTSLLKLGTRIEELVEVEMLAWANGEYEDTDLVYQDETQNQLRLDVEIGLVQEMIKSILYRQTLTEAEVAVLEADSVSARLSMQDLVGSIGPTLVEARNSQVPLVEVGLSLTEWFPTEIEILAEATGISMYDLA